MDVPLRSILPEIYTNEDLLIVCGSKGPKVARHWLDYMAGVATYRLARVSRKRYIWKTVKKGWVSRGGGFVRKLATPVPQLAHATRNFLNRSPNSGAKLSLFSKQTAVNHGREARWGLKGRKKRKGKVQGCGIEVAESVHFWRLQIFINMPVQLTWKSISKILHKHISSTSIQYIWM